MKLLSRKLNNKNINRVLLHGGRMRKISHYLWDSHNRSKDMLTMKKIRQLFIGGINNETGLEEIRPKTYSLTQFIGLLLGPLFFSMIYWGLPLEGLSLEGRGVFAIIVLVATWWILEVMPLGITSLLPIILLPIFTNVSGKIAATSYADPLNFLFLGGFAIALALERWRLHERIAITVISLVGTSLSGLIIGFMLATGILSMWVSNTATALLMIPIGTAIATKIIQLMRSEDGHERAEEIKFEKSIIFAIGFGATIGGSATLIGTPTNLILAGLSKELLGIDISFARWMLFAVPLISILMVIASIYLTKFAYPLKIKRLEGSRAYIEQTKVELGKMSYEEIMVSLVFVITAFFWITRTFLWVGIIPGISDTMIAIAGALLLYLIPTRNGDNGRLLDGSSLKKMPWAVLLLVGAGMAIAAGFSSTDLSEWAGQQLLALKGTSYFVILCSMTFISILMTQVTPNTATGTILLPIAITLATATGSHPLPLMTASALGAGFAYMMPISTPSNAIIFATGKITFRDMLEKGTYLTFITLVLILAFVYFIFPLIFKGNMI